MEFAAHCHQFDEQTSAPCLRTEGVAASSGEAGRRVAAKELGSQRF